MEHDTMAAPVRQPAMEKSAAAMVGAT